MLQNLKTKSIQLMLISSLLFTLNQSIHAQYIPQSDMLLSSINLMGQDFALTTFNWTYNGNESFYNGKRGKITTFDTYVSKYIFIESHNVTDTDPLLYYSTPGGTWNIGSDDDGTYENGRNYKIVIHLNSSASRLYLCHSHYSSSDLLDYNFDQIVYDNDPVAHNCYYLEVYPDRIEKIWHN